MITSVRARTTLIKII